MDKQFSIEATDGFESIKNKVKKYNKDLDRIKKENDKKKEKKIISDLTKELEKKYHLFFLILKKEKGSYSFDRPSNYRISKTSFTLNIICNDVTKFYHINEKDDGSINLVTRMNKRIIHSSNDLLLNFLNLKLNE